MQDLCMSTVHGPQHSKRHSETCRGQCVLETKANEQVAGNTESLLVISSTVHYGAICIPVHVMKGSGYSIPKQPHTLTLSH